MLSSKKGGNQTIKTVYEYGKIEMCGSKFRYTQLIDHRPPEQECQNHEGESPQQLYEMTADTPFDQESPVPL